ncbi:glycerophosphodiester phosphodiesterase family protein [Mucilaginibacter terrae]|uniref:Glycerophosphoryl diester phosphodiesterase n=1 Tax=Mucilaginibacter terrae TaxID=1955052 RepID=A0ABU3GVK7_9SPHI|nr:glycerophosphodiester phosphodiesterase family protein [Mucilaginibacter terrae]MDT3403809.1 glycerophosphoryl diester phosphodiesterase [Mucilaginibacter terrae]
MTTKIFLSALLLLTAIGASAQNKVMVAAHRGDWRNAPENSLLAFKNATAMGVDVVELDLAKTSDGVIVIMHDQTIDRTTNGKGKPSDFTFDEIRKFGLRNGLGRVTNNHIPTLKEVMLELKGKPVMVNLDKSWPYYNEAYAILQETGTLTQAIFKAEVTYAELKDKYPALISKITYMPIVNLDKPDAKQIITNYLKNMKPYAFELNFKQDTSSVLKDNKFITSKGAKVWLNSLWASLNAGHEDDLAVEQGNTKDSWDWLIAHGAMVLQTDRPKELLQYLKAKKLHN